MKRTLVERVAYWIGIWTPMECRKDVARRIIAMVRRHDARKAGKK
jgi:hypothetical protein